MKAMDPRAAESAQLNEVGLCAHCRQARVIRSDRGSTFYQCRRSFNDPAYAKYPQLPVRTCSGFEQMPAAGAEPLDGEPHHTPGSRR